MDTDTLSEAAEAYFAAQDVKSSWRLFVTGTIVVAALWVGQHLLSRMLWPPAVPVVEAPK